MVTNEKEKMELETAALDRALLGSWKKIVLTTVLGAVLVLLAGMLLLEPKYQADVVFRVTNRAQAGAVITPEDVSASRDLVESCAVVVQTRTFLQEAASLAGVDMSARELGKMVETAAVNETEFLRVTVTSTSPEEAARLAEAIGTLLPEQAGQVLKGSGAELVDAAVFSAESCGPDHGSNAVIGGLLGLLVSRGAVLILEINRKANRENVPE